jgi:hypothetical protein
LRLVHVRNLLQPARGRWLTAGSGVLGHVAVYAEIRRIRRMSRNTARRRSLVGSFQPRRCRTPCYPAASRHRRFG